jgi:hypothetical protein
MSGCPIFAFFVSRDQTGHLHICSTEHVHVNVYKENFVLAHVDVLRTGDVNVHVYVRVYN